MTSHAMTRAKMFFKHFLFATGALTCCFLTGSCNAPRVVTPKQAFFSNNPKARAHYLEFNETSVETIRDCVDEAHRGKILLLASVKQNLRATNADAYFSAVEKRLNDDYDGKMEFLKEIERNFNPDRDGLFYYSYHDANRQEQGWAIVRGGQIRKKFPMATTFPDAMK